ncbi:hypothetical protein, partial [Acetobacter aceti]|uniref:hypothetical protein n=1 Tax=Acetobacter aceti TaxID=435 RepID=UPI0019D71A59
EQPPLFHCLAASSGGENGVTASRGTGCTERSEGSWAEDVTKCAGGSAPSFFSSFSWSFEFSTSEQSNFDAIQKRFRIF